MKTSLSFRLVILFFALTLTVQISRAQTMSTILSNGPSSKRINIVLMSEGYQTNELGAFLVQATNMVNSLLAMPPYKEYAGYFNAFAISVASRQSGSDHYTPTTNLVDTYFNSTFDSHGVQRLVTIPPNDWDTNYSDGRGKVDALLQTFMPEHDLVIIIVNDPQYGGSGGMSGTPLVTSINSQSQGIVVHESGHSFGGLTDEYTTPYPGRAIVEYPNATAQTNLSSIVWSNWISANTPLPTPPTDTIDDGLFLGAEYSSVGWYRPKCDCQMNHLGVPFCEVCSEQLVKSIYQQVNSIDGFTPAPTSITVATNQTTVFNVTTLQPATHNPSIQWFTNGIAATGATNASFTMSSFRNGSSTVQAQVRDATALVRYDPANAMTDSVTWQISTATGQVSQPGQLSLSTPGRLGGGKFTFNVTGNAPRGFVILSSTNLQTWIPVSTNSLVGGQCQLTNTVTTGPSRTFYRAMALP